MEQNARIISSFYVQDELNPEIWDTLEDGSYVMKDEVVTLFLQSLMNLLIF
jgi:hypothetical protein